MKKRNVKAKPACMIFILLLFCIGNVFAAECGDVNASGSIDIVDALLIAQYYVGLDPTNFDSTVAEVSGDGNISIVDALLVAQYYVGLVSSFPGCGSTGPTNPPTATDPPTTTNPPTDAPDPGRTQAPYPAPADNDCGSWVLKDNVCCGRYCSDNLLSESCDGCGGNSGANCVVISSKASKSGVWPEVHSVSSSEPWHYSRSTHYGIGKGGACAFGLYGICTTAMKSGEQFYNPECEAFCRAYPDLCKDPSGTTFRGNWVAPPGNYYTQFWPSLPGERDNYLSCGECFEIVRTKKDGTDYESGESGYTPSVIATVADSCPCAANTKWCCGSGRDHCYEVEDFKYGCQIPPGLSLDPARERDPLPDESIHIDLCSIAMARLQSGSATGGIIDGVIPIKYRRVPCPVVGNIHVWLHSGAGNYWFALSVVNVKGLGSVTIVEAQTEAGDWVALVRDPNYSTHRPQERYGTWVIPQGAGPFALPISMRFTNGAGTTITAEGAIPSFSTSESGLAENYFIDTGVQF
ncbi:MAG: hypothetical protein JW881_07710 [Spirochaetales bacterium]|nr:hypothetical protein [Spirochaetales bacterium]